MSLMYAYFVKIKKMNGNFTFGNIMWYLSVDGFMES